METEHSASGLVRAAIRARVELSDKVHKILQRFNFKGPISFELDCALDHSGTSSNSGPGLLLECVMRTMQRDEPTVKATILTQDVVPLSFLFDVDERGKLEEFIRDHAYKMCSQMWDHEFHEWMKFDGVRVRDVHADDDEAPQ